MQQIRRQIRQAQFDQPPVIITATILESILTDLQIVYFSLEESMYFWNENANIPIR
jgi:hypothetical protein